MVTSHKLSQQISIHLGNFLFRNFFGVYNIVYPRFKRRQDAAEIAQLKAMVKPGQTILDIGANIGFYSQLLAELTGPSGVVYAFEPDPINYRRLVENCKKLQWVKTQQRAVAEKTKTIELYTSKLLNVDHRTYKVDDFEEALQIDAVSIDDFIGDQKVDFIKMDIQGFEFSELQGMRNTIAQNKDIKIVMELWPHGLKKAGTDYNQFISFLDSLDLEIKKMDHGKLITYDPSEIDCSKDYHSGYYFNLVLFHKNKN